MLTFLLKLKNHQKNSEQNEKNTVIEADRISE